MLSHKISEEDIDHIEKYIEMIASNDRETKQLAIDLADAEFGKYRLWESDCTPTFSRIVRSKRIDIIVYWLTLASVKYAGDYLFFKENSLFN